MKYYFSMPITFCRKVCYSCNEKLKIETVERTVTSDDIDYGKYVEKDQLIKSGVQASTVRYKCPHCEKRYSPYDVDIIGKTRKKYGPNYSQTEYQKVRKSYCKSAQVRGIVFAVIIAIISALIMYFVLSAGGEGMRIFRAIAVGAIVLFAGLTCVLPRKNRYSLSDKISIQKLSCEAVCNETKIKNSQYCYCYGCIKKINTNLVSTFVDRTAVCPFCNRQTLVSDKTNEIIDANVLKMAHRYWF